MFPTIILPHHRSSTYPPIWPHSPSVQLHHAQIDVSGIHHSFHVPEALTDASRPPLGESLTAGNRGHKRAPTTAVNRGGRPFKRARNDSQPSSSQPSSSQPPSSSPPSSPPPSTQPRHASVVDIDDLQLPLDSVDLDTHHPLLQDLPEDFFDIDFLDSRPPPTPPTSPPSSPYLGPPQPPARLASYIA